MGRGSEKFLLHKLHFCLFRTESFLGGGWFEESNFAKTDNFLEAFEKAPIHAILISLMEIHQAKTFEFFSSKMLF